MSVNSTIDLALSAFPDISDPVLQQEFFNVYNAIRSLALGLDDYTSKGELPMEVALTVATLSGEVINVKRKLAAMREELETVNTTVNWGQPGVLGATVPNAATVTTLQVNETLTVNGATSLKDTLTVDKSVTVKENAIVEELTTLKGNVTAEANVTAASLSVSGESLLGLTATGKFGANGAVPLDRVELPAAATDAATTQSLANSMRSLLISFGLGLEI